MTAPRPSAAGRPRSLDPEHAPRVAGQEQRARLVVEPSASSPASAFVQSAATSGVVPAGQRARLSALIATCGLDEPVRRLLAFHAGVSLAG